MPSRDIEQSLREDVEGYLRSRFEGLREEAARLQEQLNQAFAALSERMNADAGSSAPVAVAIAEHLRQARNRGIEEAAEGSTRARSSGDVAIINRAVEDLVERTSQSDALSALVDRAASFAPRVAFFVVRGDRATGWRARGLEGTVGDDAVREISLPLTADTLLGDAARTRRSWSGAPGSHAEDNQLYSHLGGEPPQRIVAVPLVVRGKTVAVLYADSAEQDAVAVNLEALETLVRVAGQTVELIAARRPAAQAAEAQAPEAQAEAPQAERAEEPRAPEAEERHEAFAPAAEAEAPAAETHVAEEPPPVEAEAQVEAPAEEVEEAEPVAAEPEPAFTAQPEPAFAPEPEMVAEPEPAPAEPAPSFDSWTGRTDISSAPAFEAPAPPPEPVAPRRRYGADAELPIEVSAEERPVHDRARRFARLLVSEIKLYNEQKVQEGRDAGDLYARLREDIDRSREMYDKRFAEQVGGRYDYFHHELVNTLADGDAAKLGSGYPNQ